MLALLSFIRRPPSSTASGLDGQCLDARISTSSKRQLGLVVVMVSADTSMTTTSMAPDKWDDATIWLRGASTSTPPLKPRPHGDPEPGKPRSAPRERRRG